MSVAQEKATECAACGGPIVEPWGPMGDFCCRECFRSGRAFCRQCGKPLPQSEYKGFKKAFCNDLCKRKYHRGEAISPSYFEERRRSTCKACGKSITQNKTGSRQFCTKRCNDAYYRTSSRGYSFTDEWGTYAPETRKILQELQSLDLSGTAQRLALAIDREYKVRHKPEYERTRDKLIVCHCKTCGIEFYRKLRATTSKDYCSPGCHPSKELRTIQSRATILTWEQVDEIRDLWEKGQISQRDIALKYDVSRSTIKSIVNYFTWKPEDDPREKGQRHMLVARRSGENASSVKLTWEQVDEIRNLWKDGWISQPVLAEKYGVTRSTISSIVQYRNWKPQNDPRDQVTSPSTESKKPEIDPEVLHRARQGGENASSAKLTWEKVDEIRRLYEAGEASSVALAKKYGVTPSTVGAILHYRNWKPEHDPRRQTEDELKLAQAQQAMQVAGLPPGVPGAPVLPGQVYPPPAPAPGQPAGTQQPANGGKP